MIYDKLPTVSGKPSYWTVPYENGESMHVEGNELRELRSPLMHASAYTLEDMNLLIRLDAIRHQGTRALNGKTPEEHAQEIADLNDDMLSAQPIFARVHIAYALPGDTASPAIARIVKLRGLRHEPARLHPWDQVSKVIEGKNGRLFRRLDSVTVLGRVATKPS